MSIKWLGIVFLLWLKAKSNRGKPGTYTSPHPFCVGQNNTVTSEVCSIECLYRYLLRASTIWLITIRGRGVGRVWSQRRCSFGSQIIGKLGCRGVIRDSPIGKWAVLQHGILRKSMGGEEKRRVGSHWEWCWIFCFLGHVVRKLKDKTDRNTI